MILQSKRVYIDGQFQPAQLVIEKGKISKVATYQAEKVDQDYGDCAILPGFIDIHTHGAYGFDTNEGDKEGLKRWARRITEEGVTSFLPTSVSQEAEGLKKALANVADVMDMKPEGAEILGIHMEGPFISPERKGCHDAAVLLPPSVEKFEEFQQAARGHIRYLTLCPERDVDCRLTRYCAEHGVIVSLGHSDATYEQALEAVEHGATTVTHVYNAMSPFHHRAPGLVGAALHIPSLYGEIIADGLHTHLSAISLLFMAKGSDHAILVTDSLLVKGCTPGGEYHFAGNTLTVGADCAARVKGTNTIAGSTLQVNEGLRLLVEEAKVPIEAAINACTINPARCLQVDHRKGRIQVGFDADLVVLDKQYKVVQTYCYGDAKL